MYVQRLQILEFNTTGGTRKSSEINKLVKKGDLATCEVKEHT